MFDAEFYRKIYDRYMELHGKGDVDGILSLYAEDAVIEDPIGKPPVAGHADIRSFYEASAGKVTMKRTGPVRSTDHEVACPLVILLGPAGEQRNALDVISAMVFDDDGKITSMRAWWSFDALRPATEADEAL